jgi:ankyrin repeat protein
MIVRSFYMVWLLAVIFCVCSIPFYVAARRRKAARTRTAAALRQGYVLNQAIVLNNVTLVTQLLNDGADVEAVTASGDTLLHLAAGQGYTDLLPLLTTPTTLNRQNARGLTPLQVAMKRGRAEAAAVLIEAGASRIAADSTPTLLELAASWLCASRTPPRVVLDALLEESRNPDIVARAVRTRAHNPHLVRPRTPLHSAAALGCQELVVNLLKAGADRDEGVGYQHAYTPLHMAAEEGHAHLVPLLATPANINVAHHWAQSPLGLAVFNGHGSTAEALLAAGAASGAHNELLQQMLHRLVAPVCMQ